MSEYISKEDISRALLERKGTNESCLIKARENRLYESKYYFETLLFEDDQIENLIEGLTSADVRPNIHGHWDFIGDNCFKCTACKEVKTYNEITNSNGERAKFCPDCGADMREPIGEKGGEE